jgi:ParB-like chromosome segregation protein Spo0J
VKKLEWHTEKRKIIDLVPYEGNPRQMTEKQAKDLEISLKRFNLVEIPAVDRDGTIIAGHQRVNILTALGRGDEEIEVRIPNRKLTHKEFEEYNLRSNKNLGEWNWDMLAGIDLNALLDAGFTSEELNKHMELGLLPDEEPEYDENIETNNKCPQCGYEW